MFLDMATTKIRITQLIDILLVATNVQNRNPQVTFASENDALGLTDGKNIYLSKEVIRKNPRAAIALGLHEASHILYSDLYYMLFFNHFSFDKQNSLKALQKLYEYDVLSKTFLNKPNELYSIFERVKHIQNLNSNSELTIYFNTFEVLKEHYRNKIEKFKTKIGKPQFVLFEEMNDFLYEFLTLVNVVEDRRIDKLVFETCPGYKHYYDSLYDYAYKLSKETPIVDPLTLMNYLLLYFLDPLRTKYSKEYKKIPDEVVKIRKYFEENLENLHSTEDSYFLSYDILKMIYRYFNIDPHKYAKEIEQEYKTYEPSEPGEPSESSETSKTSESSETSETGKTEQGESKQGKSNTKQKETENKLKIEIDNRTKGKIKEFFDFIQHKKRKKDFINSERELKQIKLFYEKLESCETQFIDIDTTYLGKKINVSLYSTAINFYYTSDFEKEYKNPKYTSFINHVFLEKLINNDFIFEKTIEDIDYERLNKGYALYTKKKIEAIQHGIKMGVLQRHKLKATEEYRDLIIPRLKSGKIDPRQVARYKIDDQIFYKKDIRRTYKYLFSISIDMSSSMEEIYPKICYLVAYLTSAFNQYQNVRIRISLKYFENYYIERVGTRNLPLLINIYDSKYNKDLNLLFASLVMFSPTGGTPEALLYPLLIQNSDAEYDKKFQIILTDGEMNGLEPSLLTLESNRIVNSMVKKRTIINVTEKIIKEQVKKLEEHGYIVLPYYLVDASNTSSVKAIINDFYILLGSIKQNVVDIPKDYSISYFYENRKFITRTIKQHGSNVFCSNYPKGEFMIIDNTGKYDTSHEIIELINQHLIQDLW